MNRFQGKIINGQALMRVQLAGLLLKAKPGTTELYVEKGVIGEFDALIDTGAQITTIPAETYDGKSLVERKGQLVWATMDLHGVGGVIKDAKVESPVAIVLPNGSALVGDAAVNPTMKQILIGASMLEKVRLTWDGPAGTFTLEW